LDAGIAIFMPRAVEALQQLSRTTLQACTTLGLARLYQQQQQTDSDLPLDEYARKNALSIDLQMDLLPHLCIGGSSSGIITDGTNGLRQELQDALSLLPFQVLTIPQGRALQLETTQELVHFLTRTVDLRRHQLKQLPLLKRHSCWVSPPLKPDNDVVVKKSIVEPTESLAIGAGSVVEHCLFPSELYKNISIGTNCMVSGWRPTRGDQVSLCIPDDICVQMISLRDYQVVYMVLGMQDGIHQSPCISLYNLPWRHMVPDSSILWPNEKLPQSIWHARLHPIVQEGTRFESIFGWLIEKLGSRNYTTDASGTNVSFDCWRALPRISLYEMQFMTDANHEWAFRTQLKNHITITRRDQFHIDFRAYLSRDDAPTAAGKCDWAWLVDLIYYDLDGAEKELLATLNTLQQMVQAEFEHKHYHMCGRTFMKASALLADVLSARRQAVAQDQTLSHIGPSASAIRELSDLYMELLRSSDPEFHSQQCMALEKIMSYTYQAVSETDNSHLEEDSALATCSEIFERLAFCMTEKCVMGGRMLPTSNTESKRYPILDKWVISTAPARIDLAGGWSDTPPICYEFGGAVTGLAVTVDSYKALSCRCRILPGQTGVFLRSEIYDSSTGTRTSCAQTLVGNVVALGDFRNQLSDCALLKCALVCLGMVSMDDIRNNRPLHPLINQFCGSSEDVRMEIVVTSLLPQGSGMGTSSILGGCALAAIAKAVGRVDMEDEDHLIHSVLILEQLLSAGGGYQDQVNGLIGGLKTVTSQAGRLPLEISVERVDISPATCAQLNQRLILAFTGKTRLAKGMLQDVLRRWARRTPEILHVVKSLVEDAHIARGAVQDGDLELLGECLNSYWKQKKIMAGAAGGVEPDAARQVIDGLLERKSIVGASLCGAGGGGFMVLLCTQNMDRTGIQTIVQNEMAEQSPDIAHFTWHDCDICFEGLTTQVLSGDFGADEFNIDWHKSQQA
jgi:galactokinase/mevalonate kinase-like predicted kinase